MAGSATTARPRVSARSPACEVARASLSWLWIAAVLALAAGALILRLYSIQRSSLWLDEGYTLLFSGMSLPRLLSVGGAHEHPPLFYLLVHFLRLVNPSYFVPRYLSAVCGALSLIVLFALGARIHSRATGLIAVVLMAAAPFHLWFSRDGRDYELAGLVVLLSYYMLFTALDRPRLVIWAGYAMATVLCLYTEYTTVFVLFPQALMLVRARERGLARPLLFAWAATVVLFLPWIGVVAGDTATIAGNYWIPAPNFTAWSSTVLEFLGLQTSCSAQPCTGTQVGIPVLPGHEVLLAWLATAVALGVGLAGAYRRNLVVSVLSCWLLGSFGLLLLVSIARSLFLDRVLLDATFPLYLLVGIGISGSPRRLIQTIPVLLLAVVMLAASIASIRPIYAGNPNPDWGTAMRDLRSAYRSGEGAAFYPGALRSLVGAYLPTGWHPTRDRPMWSRVYVDVPGWQKRYPTLINPTLGQRQRVETELRNRQLAWVTHGTKGTWLVTEAYPGITDVRRWFASHGFQLIVGMEYANDVRIELWSRHGPSSFGTPVAGLLDGKWKRLGAVSSSDGILSERDGGSVRRSFAVKPGETYSLSIDYDGTPPARPRIGVLLYDSHGRQIASFPRDDWYDLPVTGVWTEDPFGFIVPPNAARAVLYAGSYGGPSEWRDITVYRDS